MENWKKTFAIIWTGQFLSLLSSSVVGFAIVFWMSIETGSAEVLAYATIAAFLPQSLLGILAGVYVDRWDRKRTMIIADTFIATCTLVLAILFWMDVAELWHIYLLMACRSVGSAFHMPAMQASVPLLAPQKELVRVAGVNQAIQSVCNIAAPALGAALIGLVNMGNILILDVVGAVLACTSLLFVHIPRPERKEGDEMHILSELKESVNAVRSKKQMGWLFFFSTSVTFFLMPVAVLFPLYTIQHFGGNEIDMSIIEICWGSGALLGGLIMGARSYKINKVILINVVNVLVGIYFTMAGLLPPSAFIVFGVLTAFGGIMGAVFNSAFVAVIQTHIHPSVLGRVLSFYFSISMLPAVIGLLGTGFLAEEIGIAVAFVLSGVMISLIGIVSFFFKDMIRLGEIGT